MQNSFYHVSSIFITNFCVQNYINLSNESYNISPLKYTHIIYNLKPLIIDNSPNITLL